MLPTSSNFNNTIIEDSIKAVPRIRMWKSWNHLLDATVSAVDNTDLPIDEDLFPVESVLNERHQTSSGSAYAITGEARTSTNPRQGYRVAPADKSINPMYISRGATGGAGSTSGSVSTVQVVYPETVDANMLEIQLEALRTATTYHAVNVRVDTRTTGGSWVTAYSGTIAASAEGRLTLFRQSGGTWTTTANYDASEEITGLRLLISDTVSSGWYPKIRYIGAHHIVDVTEDLLDFSVDKAENEQLSYMPFGEPNANTATINLDNTVQKYAYKPVGQVQPKFDVDMRFDIELGLDLSDALDGSNVEYIQVGTFYVDSMDYDTQDMSFNISLSDYSKFFQRKFLDDAFWEGRSLAFIIKDILARTGMDASLANFEFGVSGNADETNKIPYCWYRSDASVWAALSELVKSEIGTLFIREDGSMAFTDREFLNIKYNDGIQWTVNADIDLESAAQEFSVDANDVTIYHRDVGPNTDPRGIVSTGFDFDEETEEISPTFSTTGPIEINSELWAPGGDFVLNSAPLYTSITSSTTTIRLDKDAGGQTFPETGEINIEGEYITYDGIDLSNANYVRLLNCQRGQRGTTPKAHSNAADEINALELDARVFRPYIGDFPHVTFYKTDGRLGLRQICKRDPYNTFLTVRPFGDFSANVTGSQTKIHEWETLMTFRELTGTRRKKDNMGGIFVNGEPSTWVGSHRFFETFWIEVLSLTELQDNNFAQGTVRVYKTGDSHPVNVRAGVPPTEQGVYGFPAAIVDDDIPVKINVRMTDASPYLYSLYINDAFITSWQADYAQSELEYHYSRTTPELNQILTGETRRTGHFGVFARGNTRVDFDYFSYQNREDEDLPARSLVFNYKQGGFTDSQRVRRVAGEQFTEFGSIAHEARSFDVEHQVFPNRWARIFNSNELEAMVFNERHTAFSSKFDIVNTSRTAAVLVGNDNSSLYNGIGVNHQFFVYGGSITEKETKEYNVKNESAIRKRGVSSVEIDNPWIQSEKKAKAIGNWVKNNWADPVDFFTIEWFPMWALQPGDRIQVTYPEKGFSEVNFIWFIKSMSLSYDGGLTGTIQIQRRTSIT